MLNDLSFNLNKYMRASNQTDFDFRCNALLKQGGCPVNDYVKKVVHEQWKLNYNEMTPELKNRVVTQLNEFYKASKKKIKINSTTKLADSMHNSKIRIPLQKHYEIKESLIGRIKKREEKETKLTSGQLFRNKLFNFLSGRGFQTTAEYAKSALGSLEKAAVLTECLNLDDTMSKMFYDGRDPLKNYFKFESRPELKHLKDLPPEQIRKIFDRILAVDDYPDFNASGNQQQYASRFRPCTYGLYCLVLWNHISEDAKNALYQTIVDKNKVDRTLKEIGKLPTIENQEDLCKVREEITAKLSEPYRNQKLINS